jgi:hypothetical protein
MTWAEGIDALRNGECRGIWRPELPAGVFISMQQYTDGWFKNIVNPQNWISEKDVARYKELYPDGNKVIAYRLGHWIDKEERYMIPEWYEDDKWKIAYV